ncbi:hypothetical protein DFH11DRAFT_1543151 [Phellopilus nigrolimitatus]|nr:hypothetical protein DFH11DRAFT_1543151 [Phellopilus nigrolimitatus]
MFLFRSSFITAAFVCVITIVSQCATVFAAPQLGMRPYLHVYGVEESGSALDVSSLPSATVAVEPSATLSSAAESTETVEATQPPDSGGDTQTEAAVQTNGAFSPTSGIGIALFVGSVTAVLQII